jgi:ATP-binding cassette subfamily F protein uup
MMVTHDRYFFDRVINRTLELDNGKAYLYQANYSGFLAKRAERRQLENSAARKLQNVYRRELAWIQRGALRLAGPRKRTGWKILPSAGTGS